MEATHFIEQWVGFDGGLHTEQVEEILDFDYCLSCTTLVGGTTIAIFKIRYKC